MGGVLVVLNRAPHPCLLKSIGVAEWQEFVNLICTKMNEGFVLGGFSVSEGVIYQVVYKEGRR